MKNLKDKLSNIISTKESKWRENAQNRRNKPWLSRYSSQIARRILVAIENNKDLNQAKLAEILDVSPQQISKIVKGHENLTLETIYKLSTALETELISFPDYKYSQFPTELASFEMDTEKIEEKDVCKIVNMVFMPQQDFLEVVNSN